MSHPPGPAEPNDPWRPPPGAGERPPDGYAAPGYGQPPYGAPGYGQPPYGAPGYGQPPYGAPAYPPGTNGKALGAVWTGIGAVVLSLCCGVGLLAAPVAIILGVRARAEIRAAGGRQAGDGLAVAGIVTGVLAILLSLVLLSLITLALISGNASYTFDDTRV